MLTETSDAGAAYEGLRDAHETADVRLLCLDRDALAGPVGAARESLAAAQGQDRHEATATVRAALAELSGVPGAAALEVRQRLSRMLIGLLDSKAPWEPVAIERSVTKGEETTMSETAASAALAPETIETTEEQANQGPIAPETKQCARCQAWQPLDAFGRNKQGPLGKCKACVSQAQAAGWEKRRAAKVADDGPAQELADLQAAHALLQQRYDRTQHVLAEARAEVASLTDRLNEANGSLMLRETELRTATAQRAQLGEELGNLVTELQAMTGETNGDIAEILVILRERLEAGDVQTIDAPTAEQVAEEVRAFIDARDAARVPTADDGPATLPAGEDPSLLLLAAEAVEALGAMAAFALREAGHARGAGDGCR